MEKIIFKKSIFIIFGILCVIACFILLQTICVEAEAFQIKIYEYNLETSELDIFETIDVDSSKNYSEYIRQADLDAFDNNKIVQYYKKDDTKEFGRGDPFMFSGPISGNVELVRVETQGYILYTHIFDEEKKEVKALYNETELNFYIRIDPLTQEEIDSGYAYYIFNPTSKKVTEKLPEEKIGKNLNETLHIIKLKEYKVSYYKHNGVSYEKIENQDFIVTNLHGEVTLSEDEIINPPLENKKFLGWVLNIGSNDPKKELLTKYIDDNVNLYEYSEKTYNITLNIDTQYSDKLTAITQTNFETIMDAYYYLKNIKVDHYIVKTTLNVNDEETTLIDGETLYTWYLTEALDDNISLKVTLDVKKYTVFIDYKNGSTLSFDFSIATDETTHELPTTLSKRGYKHIGYLINGVEKTKQDEWVVDLTDLRNQTVEAIYEAREYKLILKYNEDLIDKQINSSNIYITFGTKFQVLNQYVNFKKGHTVNKWKIGNNEVNAETIFDDKFLPDIDELVVFAEYSPNSYVITKDLGFDETQEVRVVYGKQYSIVTPQKIGYDFAGWIYNGEKFNANGSYIYDTDITIKAQWEPKQYTVKVFVKDKEFEFTAKYDNPLTILKDEMKGLMNLIVGFKGDGIVVGRDGVIEKYDIPSNIELHAVDFAPFSFDENSYNSMTFNLTGLNNLSIYLNDQKAEIINNENFTLTKVGNYRLELYVGNNNIFTKEFTLHADIGIESKIYEEPIVIKKIDAKIFVDGEEIDPDGYRITKNGNHTIKVVGVNGYEKTFTVEYKNNNILYAIILTIIAFAIAIGTGVILFLGRGKVIKYDNND